MCQQGALEACGAPARSEVISMSVSLPGRHARPAKAAGSRPRTVQRASLSLHEWLLVGSPRPGLVRRAPQTWYWLPGRSCQQPTQGAERGGGSGERRPRYAQGRTRRTGSCGPPGTHLAPVRCMSSVTTTAPSAVPSPWLPSLADSPSARARFVGGFSDEGLSVAKIEASPPMRPARKSALVGRGRHCQWVALGPTSRRRGGGTDRMQEVARSLRRGAPSPRTGCVARVKVESVGVPHVQRRRAVAAAAHHGRLSAQAFRGLAPQVPAWGIVAGPPAARGA